MSRLRLVLLSLLAVLAVGAVASASASALEWYVNGTLLPVHQLLEIEGKGTSGFVLKTVVGTVKLELTDTAANVTSTGWVENSLMGALDFSTTTFANVVVAAPAGHGCTATLNPVNSHTLLVTLGANVYDEFTEAEVGFAKVTIANCTGGAAVLNGTYEVKGKAWGKVSGDELSFEKGAPNNELFFGGNEAEFTGKSLQTMKGSSEPIEGR